MNPSENITLGMSGTQAIEVTPELTVAHFVSGMPLVYATPMMILLMEQASGRAIAEHLPPGWVSVGTEVNIRHLAATPVGRAVIATARVVGMAPGSVEFAVDAHDGTRKIGEGTHRRGLVEVAAFEKRFGVTRS